MRPAGDPSVQRLAGQRRAGRSALRRSWIVALALGVGAAIGVVTTLGVSPGRSTPLEAAESAPSIPAPVAPLLEWRPIELAGVGDNLRSVVWHDGRMLAISSGSVVGSVDGSSWAPLDRPIGNRRARDLKVAGDRLVLRASAADPEADVHVHSWWWSANAVTWHVLTAEEDTDRTLSDFARFNGAWIAIGEPEAAYRSEDDGDTWLPLIDGPEFERASLATGPGGVLVGATEGVDEQALFLQASSLFSPDGSTWVQTRLEPGMTTIVDAVASNAGRYVAFGAIRPPPAPRRTGGPGAPDGASWARVESDYDAAAWWSLDGVAWRRATVEQDRDVNHLPEASVVQYRDGFLAIGEDGVTELGRVVWWSADGRAWIRLPGAPQGEGGDPSIVVDGDRVFLFAETIDDGPVAWVAEPR